MVTKVRGAFNEFEGSAVVDGTDFTKSTGQLTIQAASIDTRNEQRDAHLRGNDFLAMEEYPQITFVATDIRQTGATTLQLTGDLTIRGVTNSVTIAFEFGGAATDPFGNLRVGFEGSTVINRRDYGITWNAALETGGVLVSDKITLEFEVSAIKTASSAPTNLGFGADRLPPRSAPAIPLIDGMRSSRMGPATVVGCPDAVRLRPAFPPGRLPRLAARGSQGWPPERPTSTRMPSCRDGRLGGRRRAGMPSLLMDLVVEAKSGLTARRAPAQQRPG